MTSAPPPGPPSADPPAWPPPPPPPSQDPAARRPQLRRSSTDKMIGGVAGGLAEYSGVDALLWRVGFVALTFAGGSGVLVYLLLWLLMPAGPPGEPGTTGSRWPAGRAERPPAGPRSPVPGVTVAAVLIAIGALVLFSRITEWHVEPHGYFGTALLIVGLGLVAAAFSSGRTARGGLIGLGVVLALGLVIASTAPWHGTRGGVGDQTFRPLTAEQVREVYDGGVGDMTLDLTRIDVSDLDRPITARVEHDVGDIDIRLPRDADVQLSVMTGLGSVDVLGEGSVEEGFFVGRGSGSWVDDDEPEFDLVIHHGVGDLEVSRG